MTKTKNKYNSCSQAINASSTYYFDFSGNKCDILALYALF